MSYRQEVPVVGCLGFLLLAGFGFVLYKYVPNDIVARVARSVIEKQIGIVRVNMTGVEADNIMSVELFPKERKVRIEAWSIHPKLRRDNFAISTFTLSDSEIAILKDKGTLIVKTQGGIEYGKRVTRIVGSKADDINQ